MTIHDLSPCSPLTRRVTATALQQRARLMFDAYNAISMKHGKLVVR